MPMEVRGGNVAEVMNLLGLPIQEIGQFIDTLTVGIIQKAKNGKKTGFLWRK